jgi:hypothetical protein
VSTRLNATVVILRWRLPGRPNGRVTHYELSRSARPASEAFPSNDGRRANDGDVIYTGSGTDYTDAFDASDAVPSIVYSYRVTAYTAVGGSPSEPTSFVFTSTSTTSSKPFSVVFYLQI